MKISKQQCQIYKVLKDSNGWLSNKEIVEMLGNEVSIRCVRYYTKCFTESGISEVALFHPAHLFKFVESNPELDQAVDVFGLE